MLIKHRLQQHYHTFEEVLPVIIATMLKWLCKGYRCTEVQVGVREKKSPERYKSFDIHSVSHT